MPALGTSAHAFTMLHTSPDGPDEPAAFRTQVDALGVGTTLLVDTYDVTTGISNAVAVAGPGLGAVRIDSGDLGVLARQARAQLDGLGATGTQIVVSGDLDEYSIAALRADPVDSYGVGTSLVTGSGAPTASMVYKLVEVDGIPVQKRSSHKESHGGRKAAVRLSKAVGHRHRGGHPSRRHAAAHRRAVPRLSVPLVRAGDPVATDDLAAARARVATGLKSLPWEGLKLSHGEPAIPTAGRGAIAVSVTDLLARAVAALGGSERSGQIEMAEAVAHAFETGEHLAVQAGTGTGKSLAYLVPALALAAADDDDDRGPVVVSTATIALQRQLVDRDLPRLTEALAGALPRAPSFALLKGRGNYLCLNKIHNGSAAEDPPGQDELFEPFAADRAGPRRAAAHRVGRGHRDRRPRRAAARRARPGLDAGQRLGAGMHRRGPLPVRRRCFSEKARAKRRRWPTSSSPTTRCWPSTPSPTPPCCPSTTLLVVDEAHELVDRVTSVATAELTSTALGVAMRRAGRLVGPETAPSVWRRRRPPSPRRSTTPTPGRIDYLDDELATLPDRAARRRARRPRRPSTPSPATRRRPPPAPRRVTALDDITDTASRILTSFDPPIPDRTDVVWLDRRGRPRHSTGASAAPAVRSVLRVAPLSVAGLLRDRLFDTVDRHADLGDADRRRHVRRDGAVAGA